MISTIFKRINDTLGHQAGDLVLKHMADLLQENCRAGDYLCRYGGEEICVLLPNADEELAAAWAERARRAIEAATGDGRRSGGARHGQLWRCRAPAAAIRANN